MIDGIIDPEYEVKMKDMEKEADDELYAEEGIFDVSGMFFDTPKRPLPIMSQPPPKRRKIQQPWEMQQQPCGRATTGTLFTRLTRSLFSNIAHSTARRLFSNIASSLFSNVASSILSNVASSILSTSPSLFSNIASSLFSNVARSLFSNIASSLFSNVARSLFSNIAGGTSITGRSICTHITYGLL